MSGFDHWSSELPDIGLSFTILRLLDEQTEARETVEFLKKRIVQIDDEILSKIQTSWTDEEIAEARKIFEKKRRLEWIQK